MRNIFIFILCIITCLLVFIHCDPNPGQPTTEPTGTPVTEATPEPTAVASGPFAVSGSVKFGNIALIEAELKLSGDPGEFTVRSDEAGEYTFRDLPGGSYTLTAAKTGFAFAPGSLAVALNRDLTGQNFTGSAAAGFRIDPWGYAWDANPRTAVSWDAARANCELAGGRLPTVTELYRNSNNTRAPFGGTTGYTTAYLWTNIEWSNGYYTVVRQSDGDVSYAGTGSAYAYRCVWPNMDYDTFRGSYIYTAPGEAGFQVKINGGLFYMDTLDRAPMPYNPAIREAAFYHAFIPPESLYTAVIRDGLPNGSGTWLWTSDMEGHDGGQFCTGVIRWNNIDLNFTGVNNTYATQIRLTGSTEYSFRCAGVSKKLEPNPKVLPNGTDYLDPGSLLRTTNTNQGTVNMFTALCNSFNSGGHLPTQQEMMLLVQSGLPNDTTNASLWTSEYESGAYVGVVYWTGIAPHFDGYYSTYVSWSGHAAGTLCRYRPVYHPIDESYTGPSDTDCIGGRFEVSKDLGNGKAIKIWADAANRPAARFYDAVTTCYSLGGHLASRRDLVELLVNGLQNGNDTLVWTSDKANYYQYEVIKLLSDLTGYSDQSADGNYALEAAHSTGTVNSYSYRCVWTNEVRIR